MSTTKDILLYESGSGGELSVENNDIELIEQLYQQCYLALFGGNIEAATLGNEPPSIIRDDWWGNSLLFPQNTESQFNSLTEKALRENPMISQGRINIQRAVDADLQYLKDIATVTSNVIILSTNKVQITVNLQQPQAQEVAIFQIIWDNAKQELISNQNI